MRGSGATRALLLAVLSAGCGGAAGAAGGGGHGARPGGDDAVDSAGIEWRAWDAEVFEQARAEGRIILVDVGIEGCTACRWMYEDTYRHPEVIRRVRDHFLAVSVDADVQPDLGERYARWGWPATIFLSGDGVRLMAIRGNKRPRSFLPILDELLRRQSEGSLSGDMEPPPSPPVEGELGALCAATVARVDALADREHGGWGSGPQIPLLAPVAHSFYRAQAWGETERREQALQTLESWSGILDPVWGGIFVAARTRGWEGAIPEKRAVTEAAALWAFAEAHWATGDARWIERIDLVHRYMDDWMRSADGTFYSTQEDDAPNLPPDMTPANYYRLSDPERRRYGVPPIDHGVYTDQNALLIDAYVHVFGATDDDRWLAIARRAADALLESRIRGDGWIAQIGAAERLAEDRRMRVFEGSPRLYLKPQAHFGRALLSLYGVTGEARYLDAATRMAAAMRRRLEDPTAGAFWASPVDGTEALLGRRKPFYDNVAAARFLLALHAHTKVDALREAAERALRSVASETAVRGRGPNVAALALALSELALGPVEMSVVGASTDPAAVTLFEAARRIHEPRKVLHYERPGRYPDQGRPAVYVCTREACSSPVFEAAGLADVAARFARAPDGVGCGPPPP